MCKHYIRALKKSKLLVVFILFVFVKCNIAAGQPPPHATPAMWVPDSISKAEEGYFRTGAKSKHAVLSTITGTPDTDSIFYPLPTLKSMISKMDANAPLSLRVYIAAYDTTGKVGLPQSASLKHLMLIFEPKDANDSIIGDYTIDPAGNLDTLSLDQKKAWIRYYGKNMIPLLVTTITTNPSAIENKDSTGKIGDTYGIEYHWSYIREYFIGEATYLTDTLKPSIPVTGMWAEFADFGNDGDPDNDPLLHSHYKNRLLVQWEFAKSDLSGSNTVFYIDDYPPFVHGKLTKAMYSAFEARKKAQIQFDMLLHTRRGQKYFGADNGQLCPPATNCPNP